LLTIGTADWTQAFGKALPVECTQQWSTPCTAHTAVLPPTKHLQGPLWVYFSLETHHTSEVIPHWGLNSLQVDWSSPKIFFLIVRGISTVRKATHRTEVARD